MMKDSEMAWCGLDEAMKSVISGLQVTPKVERFPSRTAQKTRVTYPVRKAA